MFTKKLHYIEKIDYLKKLLLLIAIINPITLYVLDYLYGDYSNIFRPIIFNITVIMKIITAITIFKITNGIYYKYIALYINVGVCISVITINILYDISYIYYYTYIFEPIEILIIIFINKINDNGEIITNPPKDEVCAICLDFLDYQICRLLICQHIFHNECINSWISEKKTCPMCRTIQV